MASGKASIARLHPMVFLASIGLVCANVFAMSDRALMALALIVITSCLAQVRDPKWLEQLSHILFVYLAINAAGLVFQIAALWGGGILIDLHGLIFLEASRIESIGGQHGRMSGFHNEPGTYSQWMLMTLFLRCLITGRLLSAFNVAVSVSILATVSLWGIIGVVIYLVAVTLEALLASGVVDFFKRIGVLLLFILVSAALATQVPGNVLEESLAFVEAKSGMQSDSGTDKLYAMEELGQEFWNVFIFGAPVNPGFCRYCLAPNDVGIWANMTYYFGFMITAGLGATLGAQIVRHWGIAYLPLLAIMLVWKAPFYDPALWMLIGHIYSRNLVFRH